MARTKSSWEQALQAILTGAATGAQTGQASGREMEKALMLERLKQSFNPQEYKPRTMQEALEFENAKLGQKEWKPRTEEEALGFERAKAGIVSPKEALQTKFTQARLNQLEGGEDRLTPSERRQQRGDTSKLVNALQTIPVRRTMVNEAKSAMENLPGGRIGQIKMAYIRNFDENNPLNEDWQKVKMVLTDAQLMNTALTKGAISDKEMTLFATAAANDDLLSIKRNKVVFNKLIRFLNAEEKGIQESYAINYGDKALEKVKSRLGIIQKPPAKSYVRKGTNSKGQRVGQLKDGTIEVIK